MPTYEYRCAKGHTFQRIQKMSDKPVAKCPRCGAKASRVISGGQGLIFKGSGFYITDYGKDGKGPRKDSDSAASLSSAKSEKSEKSETKSESKSEGKSESKSESKSDSKPADTKKSGKVDAA